MPTITLDEIKSAHENVASMIAKFEAQAKAEAAFPITITFPELNPGEKFAGVIISADGTKREYIILLPGQFKGSWDDSMAWAKSIGGELFDRTEGALLFATMKDEFKPEWHWTREQHAAYSGDAWTQHFNDGSQSYSLKSAQGLARAVRRLEIQ
ncbi:MAG: DUF1566 domain-containing protein [Rhodocyclaceae bacterium]|nr:DUF1566 domain-containing protein [Rhodocyclaceae bacterium]